MNAKRQKAEELIYKVFDAVDKTHTNSDYYKKLFSSMSLILKNSVKEDYL